MMKLTTLLHDDQDFSEPTDYQYLETIFRMCNVCFLDSEIVLLHLLNSEKQLFIVFAGKVIQELFHKGQRSTARLYCSTVKHVLEYPVTGKELAFEDINKLWIDNFRDFLFDSGLHENSVRSYLRVFRRIYNRAEKEGICFNLNNPFCGQDYSFIPANKYTLDSDNLLKIIQGDLQATPSLSFSRDLFLFSYYANGMSFMDMAYLKKENIINGKIEYRACRNRKSSLVKITQSIQDLLEKYQNESDFVFPILDVGGKDLYEQYQNRLRSHNKQLKKLAEILGIPCSLSFLVAANTSKSLASSDEILLSISYGDFQEIVKISCLSAVQMQDYVLDVLSKMEKNESLNKSILKIEGD